MKTTTLLCFAVLGLVMSGCASRVSADSAAAAYRVYEKENPFVKRAFLAEVDGRWIGDAVCYGPHRDGQSPEGASPTRDQILEDLQILTKRWHMLRVYGSQGVTEDILQLIREHKLDMKVVVGAWVATEASVDEAGNIVERFPETVAANRKEVEAAIRLANTYPDIVAAVTVGNETHVSWSYHKVRTPVLVNYIRQVRANTTVPVSTADVSTFWSLPESKVLADELDFIVTHIYAMWNQQKLDTAMDWTRSQYESNIAIHPGYEFAIGEAGWATQICDDDAQYIKGDASEDSQAVFYREFTTWARENRIPNFFFEAFDEKWKGGEHPDSAEKNWGLFHSDRTPKKAIAQTQ